MVDKLLEHHVIRTEYGEDIYVNVIEVTNRNPPIKEKIVKLVGNFSVSFEENSHALFLTRDELEEMIKILNGINLNGVKC